MEQLKLYISPESTGNMSRRAARIPKETGQRLFKREFPLEFRSDGFLLRPPDREAFIDSGVRWRTLTFPPKQLRNHVSKK